jgi:hypothetical protein
MIRTLSLIALLLVLVTPAATAQDGLVALQLGESQRGNMDPGVSENYLIDAETG